MTELVIVVLLLGAAACAVWLLRDPRTVPSGDGARAARVSVVVPARDEEATLPALLASLDGLRTPVLEVVVVDDSSEDATAEVARAGGARVVSASAPPHGWTGKAWACHLGADASQGDLLLFLDADTVLAPDALGGLIAAHGTTGGLVSVQPFHTVVRAYEQLSSYFNAMSVLASGVFTRRAGGRAMAFGPCLLTSRDDYEHVGGHAAVRGEILDDVALATAYARAGLPVRCFLGRASVRMRSYPGGIRQLADGWTKNFASGASAAPPGAALAAGAWLGSHHAVAVGAVLVLVEALSGWGGSLTQGTPVLWALAWIAVAWHLRSVLGRLGTFRWWTWALFPVPLLAFDVIFARSAALTLVRRSVRWRGRDVDLDRGRSEGKVT